jgi:integrase
MSVSQKSIRYIDGQLTVDVHQKKTKKDVSPPIMKPEIIAMLENSIPHKISLQNFNKYIKMVCQIAGLTELTKGYKLIVDKDKNRRKVFGIYPKWELMTSHSLRRSFATNYYKRISTPVLMAITGHSRESDFLKYINKQVDKDDNAKLFAMQYKQSMT